MNKVLITGASGFIGGHLADFLISKGYKVHGADIKQPEFRNYEYKNLYDLRNLDDCLKATEGVDQIYHLAADMGGMGFISNNQSLILRNNTLIDFNLLEAARINGVRRVFYSSSACIYPEFLQEDTNVSLKESDAYPAQPQDTYGWEKLMMEIMCHWYKKDHGIETRVARFHNIYGPYGTWTGGREKAPAAMCRKVAEAKLRGLDYIEIWGDGEQTRSFCYVKDCVEGVYRLMNSSYNQPLNIGSSEMVTINQLADIVMRIADVHLEKSHIPGPQGVRGRNSDNTLLQKTLEWEPQISLEEGLKRTYKWIEDRVRENL